MGERGPVPKRSTQRRRRNKTTAETKQTTTTTTTKPKPNRKPPAAPPANTVTRPPAPKTWHAAARKWYLALSDSGQSKFYEPSDWALAYLIAESMSRDLKPQVVGINELTGKPVMATIPMKGASLSSYLKAMTALLVSEGDRRRAGIELERESLTPDTGPAADVADLDDYRARLGG